MSDLEKIKQAKNNLKICKDMFVNKLKSYHFLKNKDDGLHSDYWQNISFANKELQVLQKNFIYWLNKYNQLTMN